MLKNSRWPLQIIFVLSLAGSLLLLSGCILEVIQPAEIVAGLPFAAQIKIDPEITGIYPIYLGIQLPQGWKVVSDPAYSEGLTGTFVYSPTVIPSLEDQYGSMTDTVWWAGVSPAVVVTGGVTVTVVTSLKSAHDATVVYTITYAQGVYTDELTWQGFARVVSMTVLPSETTLLPMIKK